MSDNRKRPAIKSQKRSLVLAAFLIFGTILGGRLQPASAGGSQTPAPVTEVRSAEDFRHAVDTLPAASLIRMGGTVISVQAARGEAARGAALARRLSALPLSTTWSKRPLSDFRINASMVKSTGSVTVTPVAPVSGSNGNITQYGSAPEIEYLPAPVEKYGLQQGDYHLASMAQVHQILQQYCPGASLCELTDPAFAGTYTKSGQVIHSPLFCGVGYEVSVGFGGSVLPACILSAEGGSRQSTWGLQDNQKLVGIEEIGCDPGSFHVDVTVQGQSVTGSITGMTGINAPLALCRVRIAVTKAT